MKSSLIFLGLILLSFNAFSFQEGNYECEIENSKIKFEYSITAITQGSVRAPYLKIVKTVYGETSDLDQVFTIKGIATEATNNKGQDSLYLQAASITLKADGTPTCAQ